MAFPTASFSDERRSLFVCIPGTLKLTNSLLSLPLKNNGWKMKFFFGKPYCALFWGCVGFLGRLDGLFLVESAV